MDWEENRAFEIGFVGVLLADEGFTLFVSLDFGVLVIANTVLEILVEWIVEIEFE